MKKLIVVIILLAIAVGAKTYVDRSARQDVDRVLNRYRGYTEVAYQKAGVDLIGWNTHLRDVTISPVGAPAETVVEDVIIYKFDHESKLPAYVRVDFKGIHVAVTEENFGSQARELERLGYEQIKADIQVDYRYDLEEHVFTLNALRVGADDMGHVEMSFQVGNIDLDPNNIFFLLFAYPNILIHRAELRYDDDSLIPRLIRLAAEQQDTTEAEVVAELLAEIDAEIERAESAFSKDALKAVRRFIAKPNKIKIVINPKEPVAVGELEKLDPREVPEALNIKVRT